MEEPLSNRLGNVLQGFIPGLSTMDAPVSLNSNPRANDNNEGAIIIDMPSEGAAGGTGDNPAEGNGNEAGNNAEARGNTASEIRAVRPLLERVLPFVLILLVKILYDHRLGVVVLIGLIGTFIHHNSSLKRQVMLRDKRQIHSLLIMLVLLPFNIFFCYYVFLEQELYKSLIFLKPNFENYDLWTLLWVTGITDTVIKFMTIAAKCAVAILPRSCLSFKRRGKHYMMIEQVSQLYRLLTPVPVWIAYLSDYTDSHWIVSYLLTFVYILAKANAVYVMGQEVRTAVRTVFHDVHYGNSPAEEDMKNAGDACPICQDVFKEPIQLHCKHIFCEECVAMWFDRERTCPMCRAKIVESPKWRDGGTTTYVQLF
ncbi:E3 ubiquitin-protein ligase RNFT2-like [Amphiura filiformis]|uniref:E3 ubiquitin-protein ligase RNFT2-like n=1 Tax=Amphiura filiformis TaxID=82378 RepID=UPI003B21B480